MLLLVSFPDYCGLSPTGRQCTDRLLFLFSPPLFFTFAVCLCKILCRFRKEDRIPYDAGIEFFLEFGWD
jgi:hypothetical protein